jgi:hypothetical protein
MSVKLKMEAEKKYICAYMTVINHLHPGQVLNPNLSSQVTNVCD